MFKFLYLLAFAVVAINAYPAEDNRAEKDLAVPNEEPAVVPIAGLKIDIPENDKSGQIPIAGNNKDESLEGAESGWGGWGGWGRGYGGWGNGWGSGWGGYGGYGGRGYYGGWGRGYGGHGWGGGWSRPYYSYWG